MAWAKDGEPCRCPPGAWRKALRRLDKMPRWAVEAALEAFPSAGVADPQYLVGIARGRVRDGKTGPRRPPPRGRRMTMPGSGLGFTGGYD